MKLDVLLINPGSRSAVYQNLGDEFSAIEPPSLAAMFATYLRRKGCSVAIVDAPANNLSPAETADLATKAFDATLIVMVVYGFQPSASTQNMTAAGETCRAIKELRPYCKILMTGTHPAALPQRTLNEEAIDAVATGEGPQTIYGALQALKAGGSFMDSQKVPGIMFRVADKTTWQTPDAGLLDDLDAEMSGGAWDLLPMDKYRSHNWHSFEHIGDRSPYVSIHTSLGCPYKCTFCCINAPFGKPSYRMWSPKTVGDEIELLVTKYGVRNIKFVDEMFVLNKAHVLGVCDEIIKRGLGDKINIWAYARVDTVKEEFLDPLMRAGFRWLALGIESASKHVRDGVEKGRFGSEEIIKTVRRVQAAGINVIGNYIFGLPDDTHETMRDTLALALEANCEFANFYSAMAYPGSKLYTLALEKGWKLPDSWIGYSQHSWETEPLPTETLTGAEVLAFRDDAFQRYFRSESYLRMVQAKFGPEVCKHVLRMVGQELPRRILS
jgi:anaerobic magnesium-protoporphyrin IX monomethyl ester cyclase